MPEPDPTRPGDPAKRLSAPKILHVVDSLEIGGLEATVVRLASAQARAGNPVRVAALFRSGPLALELDRLGISHHCVAKRSSFDVPALRRLRRIAREFGADVIHAHNEVAHYYGVAATLGLRVRRVSTRHDMGEHLTLRRRQWYYRPTMPATHAVVAVCDAARLALVGRGIVPARIATVIHNGIEPRPPCTTLDRMRARTALGLSIPEDALVVGTAARLNTVKRLDVMIEAWDASGWGGRGARLVIIGDGPERSALENIVENRGLAASVVFAGARSDVRDLLPGFDVFVSSSDTEGMSVALVEACWAGLPIAATDVGGTREIVSPGVNGLLVPRRDPTALAEAMNRLLGDDDDRRRMGREARARAERRWTVEAMREAYERVYTDPVIHRDDPEADSSG
jgi:glycosyltransferase involved in cell wall biosynthesis